VARVAQRRRDLLLGRAREARLGRQHDAAHGVALALLLLLDGVERAQLREQAQLLGRDEAEQLMLFAAVIVCLMGIMYQANTSSSFYPGALDGVTAVVMIDIIVAIIYYLTVLFSEIAILYNEDNKRVQLEKAARARGAKGESSPKAAAGDKASRDSAGGRLVDDVSGEINTGRLETATNPLFLSQAGAAPAAGGGDGAGAGADGVMSSARPPPSELWTLVQQEWRQQKDAMAQLRTQLAEARKAAAQSAAAAEGGGFAEEASPASPRSAKKSFAPAVAGGGAPSARKLLKKRSEI